MLFFPVPIPVHSGVGTQRRAVPWCVQLQSPATRGNSSPKARRKLAHLSYYKMSLALVVSSPFNFHSATLFPDYISQCPVRLHHPGGMRGGGALASLLNPRRLNTLQGQEGGAKNGQKCTHTQPLGQWRGEKRPVRETHKSPTLLQVLLSTRAIYLL